MHSSNVVYSVVRVTAAEDESVTMRGGGRNAMHRTVDYVHIIHYSNAR